MTFLCSPLAAETPARRPPPVPAAAKPLPEIERDPLHLPRPVAAMRAALIEAARSGDAEKLRLVLERNEMPPVFAKGQTGDAIAGLKDRSGDGAGRETMGILLDVLDAAYVHIDAGTLRDMYVWPWFAEYPSDRLDAAQLVEVYRVLRASEFKPSLAAGKYIAWRLGIGPDGTLHYFLTGE